MENSREAWDGIYQEPNAEDEWYCPFDQLVQVLNIYMDPENKKHRILELGVGLSSVTRCLWRAGWTNITAVDFSPAAIHAAKDQHRDLQGIVHECLDCTDMSRFPEHSFEYIIEKGMLDSLFCSLGGVREVDKAVMEISRLLKQGGFFFSVSSASRQSRLPHLVNPKFNWSVESISIPYGPGFYAYVCKKRNFKEEWFFPSQDAQQIAIEAEKKYVLPPRFHSGK